MITKCPHCGSVRKQSSRPGYDAFWCKTFIKNGAEVAVRSQHCEDLQKIFQLTDQLSAWKKAAVQLRALIPSTTEPEAVAFYEAAVEKYGV